MWLCQTCGTKNSNSNTKCHGSGCNEGKPAKVIQAKQKHNARTNVRDYCPNCKMHTNFTRRDTSKNEWSCTRCHRKCKMRGKPVPEPVTA